MKKQYISPEILCDEMFPDSLLTEASITSISNGGLTHDIETGGTAGDGDTSDSRFSLWDDEE